MDIPPVPPALLKAFGEWDGSDQPPAPWKGTTWSKWIKTSRLPVEEPIGRMDATLAAAGARDDDEAALRAFVTAMIWGYGPVGYGAWRSRRILDLSPDAGPRLREVACTAVDHGPLEAFSAMARAPLPFLGPAFGTKYVYFCTAAAREQHHDRTAPVLDAVVRRWFARHTGRRLSGSWSIPEYDWYMRCLQSWGDDNRLKIPDDRVEELIFRSQATTDGNPYWAEDSTIGSDAHGEAVAALSELRAAIDVLGPGTSQSAASSLAQLDDIIRAAAI